MTTSFRPKHDWWQLLLLGGGPIAAIIVLITSSDVNLILKVVLTLVFIVMLWFVLGTRYEAREEELVVAFGPFRLHYPWEDITRVRKGGWWAQVSSLREPRMRMAFSTDNLIVECAQEGRTRRVVVSPLDKEGFLRFLMAKAPDAVIEGLDV